MVWGGGHPSVNRSHGESAVDDAALARRLRIRRTCDACEFCGSAAETVPNYVTVGSGAPSHQVHAKIDVIGELADRFDRFDSRLNRIGSPSASSLIETGDCSVVSCRFDRKQLYYDMILSNGSRISVETGLEQRQQQSFWRFCCLGQNVSLKEKLVTFIQQVAVVTVSCRNADWHDLYADSWKLDGSPREGYRLEVVLMPS